MRLISKLSIATGVVALAMVPMAYAADVSQLYITPTDGLGWSDASISGGSTAFVDGAPDGFGSASLELQTNSYFTAQAGYTTNNVTMLAQITKLSYWAKQMATLDPSQSANFKIDADLNGDGSTDTVLTYKPGQQVGGQAVDSFVWQYWDAANGLFTSSNSYGSGVSALAGGALYNFSQIKAWYPYAKINLMGIMIGDNQRGTTIDIDGLTVGANTYDFEKVAPTGGTVINVPTTVQDCKKYGWETLFTADGASFKNQGQCVSYIVSSKAKQK